MANSDISSALLHRTLGNWSSRAESRAYTLDFYELFEFVKTKYHLLIAIKENFVRKPASPIQYFRKSERNPNFAIVVAISLSFWENFGYSPRWPCARKTSWENLRSRDNNILKGERNPPTQTWWPSSVMRVVWL